MRSIELLKWKGDSHKFGIIAGTGVYNSGRFMDLLYLAVEVAKARVFAGLNADLLRDVQLWREMYAPLGVKPV